MNANTLSLFFTIILFSTTILATEVLKKSEELPCHDLGCTVPPSAVSPKFIVVVKRETQVLKKDAELPCTDLGCTVPPTAVSPKTVEKRETEVLKKSEELPCHDLGCTIPPSAASPKPSVSVVKRASDFVGDASYANTEPPKDSVTPLGVEKESWVPRILGLGTR